MASYCAYFPDENSTLIDEVADCIAHVFNTCGFDMIYLDGSEGMRTTHAVATMKRAIFQRLQGRVLVESSSGAGARGRSIRALGLGTIPCMASIGSPTCTARDLPVTARTNSCPGTWVGGSSPDPTRITRACSPRTWSTSAASAWAGTGRCRCRGSPPDRSRPTRGSRSSSRCSAITNNCAWGSTSVRASGSAARSWRSVPSAAGRPGRLAAAPADYLPHKVTSLSDGSEQWTIQNRYAAQPLKLRIEALYACRPYDAPEAVLLTDFADPAAFDVRAAAAHVTHDLTTSTEQVRVGTQSAVLTARNATTTRQGAWTKVGQVFTPPLDMSACSALGVWIFGDGKGELLNFQLNNTREYYTGWDDHYVDVNFTGWRYYELLLRNEMPNAIRITCGRMAGPAKWDGRRFSAIASAASIFTTTTCRRRRKSAA